MSPLRCLSVRNALLLAAITKQHSHLTPARSPGPAFTVPVLAPGTNYAARPSSFFESGSTMRTDVCTPA
ncbi:hypothetical protein [Spirosoma rhododendri]|uniref:Uncharacterized protein n=1 Tax=Spirosoma rhododendri TaxID=2728024 RepID=A0A7L5DSQ7_9BACT|nr:hypothetical protein [Spirosoma rhododendri]QJD80303.1 hypothetical protein HH216_19150 [Spirosoma rhododendri]